MARLAVLSWWCVAAVTTAAVHAQIPGPVGAREFAARRAAHWAWQPLAATTPPAAGHPVDAFVDAALATAGLRRAPPAPPHVQLRRLWYDLTGLPPPPEAVARFLASPDDAAWAREVDTLLGSPHYAEAQARHWLDLVRYAETLGHESDYQVPNAWRYRDYVIRAMDADVPYDQFVREHLAGDLLPAPRRGQDGSNESVQGTAHFWCVEQTHSPVDAVQHLADRIDNQLDVVGKAMLGLTIGCARCHDHKFDAIRAADYYALAGFVQSSRYVQAPLHPADVDGPPFQALLAGQRDLAAAARAAGATESAATPRAARDGDEVIADAAAPAANWFHTGDAFGPAPWAGLAVLDPAATPPRWQALPGPFWHSGVAGTAREGVLATATFPLAQRWLHVLCAGRDCRLKVVVDGFHVVRDPIYGRLHRRIGNQDAHWVTFDLAPWAGRPAYVQAIDQRTPDLADPDHDRGSWPERGWIAVQTVLLSPHAEPPALPAAPPAWPPADTVLPAALTTALAALQRAQDALPVSPTLPALADGSGADSCIFVRGNHRTPGAPAPRRFLSALAGEAALATGPGSGRLALANAMTAADNPLLPRVFVNRLWHQLFGRGLVRTVDNLGALGEAPTHPDLLDWLAREAIAHDWSRRHVLRLLVTSATYRQDSGRRDDGETKDPANLLLHRQNVRRLPAEAVRDALLALSGRLDPTRFGPPIELPRESHVEARGRPPHDGPRDGAGRRSIYLAVRRNFLSPFLQAFDQPTPFATVGARSVSNVPAQALALANDPFVHEQCARWATALLASAADDTARLTTAWAACFARPPRADELALARDFLAAGAGTDTTWPDLLHALVDTTEFLWLR